jgi:enamine deaminase RidA (YjgF/YER057c/UK114 family)
MSTPVARIPGPGLWPLAVKAGQFVFVSGQLPIDPGSRRLVAGY